MTGVCHFNSGAPFEKKKTLVALYNSLRFLEKTVVIKQLNNCLSKY